jgi:hypothetical protein
MLSFITIIIRNDLFNKLKLLYVKERKNYTIPAAIRELNKLSIRSIGIDGRCRRLYEPNKKDLCIKTEKVNGCKKSCLLSELIKKLQVPITKAIDM